MAASRALIVLAGLVLAGCGGKSEQAESSAAEADAQASAGEAAGPEHPPEVAAAIERGHELFFGKAVCSTCHKVGDEGAMIVGPNLGVGDDIDTPFALRVGSRGPNIDPPVYVIDSILNPNAIVVPGYARSVMKSPDDIPVELSDDELVSLAAFILSIGAVEPIEVAALERARAQIPVARQARQAAKQ